MQIRLLATGTAPTHYEIEGETVNGIDLSIIEHGGEFVGSDETKGAGIRNAERDENGELWVTLMQEVGPGHWTESEWIDAEFYDPNKIYVILKSNSYSGRAWAKNGNGKKIMQKDKYFDKKDIKNVGEKIHA